MNIGKEFLLLFAVLFLPGMIAQGTGPDPRAFEDVFYHVQLLVTSIPQILLVVAVSDLNKPGSSGRFGWNAPTWRDLATGMIAVVAIWVSAGLLATVAGALVGDGSPVEPAVAWTFDRPELIPLVLVSTLAIGYREEIFYRAYITERAERSGIDARPALGGGAVLFATGHLYQGVMGFIVALTIGGVLAAVYYRSRSLHGIAIAHGLYNFAILISSGSA
ncbi:MAG: CPBP family intramembrane glutamic endopeptidase [Spirochaetota bacterium]